MFPEEHQKDANRAAAHFNLALTLNKMGKHDEATTEFKNAVELAPTNVAIKDPPILKKHLGIRDVIGADDWAGKAGPDEEQHHG